MKISIFITLFVACGLTAQEKSLRTILHNHYRLSEKRINRLFKTVRKLDSKHQRADFIKDYCVRKISKNIDKSADELREKIVDATKLKKAVTELKSVVGSRLGIVNETGTLNKLKLQLYAPDNVTEVLLEQMSEIYCPVCYEYYQSEVTDGTAHKINLGCQKTHALCSQDIGLVFGNERCLFCYKAIDIAHINKQLPEPRDNNETTYLPKQRIL